MLESRKQPRVPQQFSVQLTSVRDPLLCELVSVENLSPRGARIVTERPWEPGSHVEIRSPHGDQQARARIVYCQTISERIFGVGLNFLSQTSEWEARRALSTETGLSPSPSSPVDVEPPSDRYDPDHE